MLYHICTLNGLTLPPTMFGFSLLARVWHLVMGMPVGWILKLFQEKAFFNIQLLTCLGMNTEEK